MSEPVNLIPPQTMFRSDGRWYVWLGFPCMSAHRRWRWWSPKDLLRLQRHRRWQKRWFGDV